MKTNVLLDIRDFILPGERRYYYFQLGEKRIQTKRTYPTADIFFIEKIMFWLMNQIDNKFGLFRLLGSIPVIGSSMSAALDYSDKQQKSEQNLKDAYDLHFYFKPFKKEFREYFTGNIWKQPGEETSAT